MANLMSAQVAEKLKRMITSGEYPPNTKFPNEPALMAQLNVSRSTIREAIKLLQSNNILEIRRGRHVCPSCPWGNGRSDEL